MIQQDFFVIVNGKGVMEPDSKGRATLYTDLEDAEREARVHFFRGKWTVLRVRVIEQD